MYKLLYFQITSGRIQQKNQVLDLFRWLIWFGNYHYLFIWHGGESKKSQQASAIGPASFRDFVRFCSNIGEPQTRKKCIQILLDNSGPLLGPPGRSGSEKGPEILFHLLLREWNRKLGSLFHLLLELVGVMWMWCFGPQSPGFEIDHGGVFDAPQESLVAPFEAGHGEIVERLRSFSFCHHSRSHSHALTPQIAAKSKFINAICWVVKLVIIWGRRVNLMSSSAITKITRKKKEIWMVT